MIIWASKLDAPDPLGSGLLCLIAYSLTASASISTRKSGEASPATCR